MANRVHFLTSIFLANTMTKDKKTITITEHVLEQLLAERYPLPEWVFLPQVSNSTGTYHSRTADAIALNCYPSRGMELHGFEIKVTKQDWLHELRDPAKSVAVQQYCDRWWLVISRDDFVEQGTLPPTWGMMAVRYSKAGKYYLKIIHPAPKLETPKPFTKGFVASVFRNAMDKVTPQGALKEQYEEGRKVGVEEGKKCQKQRVTFLQGQIDRYVETIEKFQQASGVSIHQWNAENVGEVVKLLMRYRNPLELLKRQRDALNGMVDNYNNIINELHDK